MPQFDRNIKPRDRSIYENNPNRDIASIFRTLPSGGEYTELSIERIISFIQQTANELESVRNEKNTLESTLRGELGTIKTNLNNVDIQRLQNKADILAIREQIAQQNIANAQQATQAIESGANPQQVMENLQQELGATAELAAAGSNAAEGSQPAEGTQAAAEGTQPAPPPASQLSPDERFASLFNPRQPKDYETLERAAKAGLTREEAARKARAEQEELEHDPKWREERIGQLNALRQEHINDPKALYKDDVELARLTRLKQSYDATAPERAEQKASTLNKGGLDFTKDAAHALPPYIYGEEGALHKLMQRAYKETISERPFYKEPRIAEFEPLQTEAQKEAFNVMQSPDLQALFKESALGLRGATKARGYDEVSNYFNPSVEPLMKLMHDRAQQEFEEETAPTINSDYIAKGAYRSGARQKSIERAREKMNQNLSDARTQLLGKTYDTAMGASLEDLKRQSMNAAQLQELKSSEHENRVKNVNLLDEIGKRKQALEQEKLNRKYADWVEQQEYPMRATNRLSEIVRGLPPQAKLFDPVASTNTSPQQNPNFFSTIGGTMLGIGGSNAKERGFRNGGRVRKAAGGQIDDYESRLKLARDSLDRPRGSKIWDFIENLGMGIAASKSPTTAGAIQEGLPAGLAGMKQADMEHQARGREALSLTGLLEKSRMDKETFNLEKRFKEAQMGKLSQPEVSEDWKLDAVGNPIVARKVGKIYTSIGGKPVKNGILQEGVPESSQSSERGKSAASTSSSPLGQKLDVEAQAKADKAESDLMSTINEGANIISTAKALSKEIPNPLYQSATKALGAVKNVVGEESRDLSNLETYSSTISETIGPLLQKLRGLGSMSEMEFKAATGLLATADKQPTSRENLLNIVDASLQRSKSQINARNAYKEMYGSDKGFDRSWMNYVSTHPAYSYDPSSGKVKVNEKNINNWQSMFENPAGATPEIGSMVGNDQVMTSQGPRSIAELESIAAGG